MSASEVFKFALYKFSQLLLLLLLLFIR